MDGLTIDGVFYPGRSCNSLWGTRSPHKLRAAFPNKQIEPHYDEGKHCFWLALGKRGLAKAKRLGLATGTTKRNGAKSAQRRVEGRAQEVLF